MIRAGMILGRSVGVLCCLVMAPVAIAQSQAPRPPIVLLAKAEPADSDQDKKDHERALNLARQAMDAGDYPKAINLLGLVVQGWPDDATAKDLLDQARKANAPNPDYDLKMATAKRNLDSGDYDAAIARANEALKMKPGDRAAADLITRATLRKDMVKGAAATPPKAEPVPPKAVEPTPPAQSVEAPAPPPPVSDLSTNASSETRISKATKHELSISGDYFLGKGNVTMPFGFSLAKIPGVGPNITPNVAKPDRSSSYVGATLSYSFGQAWYLDVGYAQGSSSGTVDVLLGSPPTLPSSFEIKDTMYQAYVRYTFPGLRGKRLSAYLRAGASLVDADLTDTTVIPAFGLYKQTDKTHDLFGNIGFGVGYSLYTSRRQRLGLQVEGEGFYGHRSQDTREVLPDAQLPASDFHTVTIDNNLYGGIGRFTVRYEYRLGKAGQFKVFGEGGLQGKFTLISYSSSGNFHGGNFNELLWGPYIKAGLRYSF